MEGYKANVNFVDFTLNKARSPIKLAVSRAATTRT